MKVGGLRDYADARLTSNCLYCGGDIETAEHAPSKVLLDKPYPEDLPTIGACRDCNSGFSRDEEYLACLVECTISGTTDPDALGRASISRTMVNQPRLRDRIAQSMNVRQGGTTFEPEMDRVRNVAIKLAQSHVLYELSEVMRDEPVKVSAQPLATMTEKERAAFERIDLPPIWPEIGSRMMTRLVSGNPGWQLLQSGRYRYATIFGGPTTARMVLSEYLAMEVVWADG